MLSETLARVEQLLSSDADSDLARIGAALAEAVIDAVPDWIYNCVLRRYREWSRVRPVSEVEVESDSEVETSAREAGVRAAAFVADPLRSLLAADLDEQRTTPLTLVRSLVGFAGEVLAGAGVPPVVRDAFETERFPDDDYGLVPASLSALGEDVGDIAIAWGAQKAMAHRFRHGTQQS